MATIYELVTPKNIASYWNVLNNTREPYFGESKFPSKKQLGLTLSWVKGAKNAPVALQLSAFDAKAIPLSRQGFQKLETEMPFFRNVYKIDEKQRQELNNVLMSGNQDAIDLIVGRIYDDASSLIERARLAQEKMRMQALTTGSIAISGNGQAYTYSYGVPANHIVAPTNKWNVSATADPIADIEGWLDTVEHDTGVRPTEALINSITLGYLKKCDAIKNAVYVFAQGKVTVTKARVLEYLQNETGVTFYVYDKGYESEADGSFVRFVPDGVVVFMPENAVGNTWFGTTPEESDLSTGASNAEVQIVDTGVAITTTKEVHPVSVDTYGSMICLPSFELADQIIIADVD